MKITNSRLNPQTPPMKLLPSGLAQSTTSCIKQQFARVDPYKKKNIYV